MNRNTLRKKIKSLRHQVRATARAPDRALHRRSCILVCSMTCIETGADQRLRQDRRASSWRAALTGFGIEILSTGGTARLLREAGSSHRGRRLHRISRDAGRPREDAAPESARAVSWRGATCRLTCKRSTRAGIPTIDIVVVNLYPFRADRRQTRLHARARRSRTSTSAARPWCAPPPRTISTWPW